MPADFLSRSGFQIGSVDPFNSDLRTLQDEDPDLLECRKFRQFQKWSQYLPKSKINRLAAMNEKLFTDKNGIIWGRLNDNNYPRTALFLPSKYRQAAICEAHGGVLTGHDAWLKTYIRISSSYFWTDMTKEIKTHIQACIRCQIRKTQKQIPVPLQPLPIPDSPNQRIHVDLFGPLKTSDRHHKYILCMTDAFTKIAEVVAVPNKEAATVANEIFTSWICKYSCPNQIHSDGGKEFVNKVAQELFQLLNIKHTKTTPAHPQCNAQVEIFNKTVQKYLASFVDETTLDWETFLPALAFSYNTSYHSTISTTPFELLYGYRPQLPAFPAQDIQRVHYGESFAQERLLIMQKARQIAKQHAEEAKISQKAQFDKHARDHKFHLGQKILFSESNFLGRNQKLSPKWLGPATIIELTNTNAKIKLTNGKNKLLNIMRIKPFIEEHATDFTEDDCKHIDQDATPTFQELINNQTGPCTRSRMMKAELAGQVNLINDQTLRRRSLTPLESHYITQLALRIYSNQIPDFDPLTSAERKLWDSLSKQEICLYLTGSPIGIPEWQSTVYYGPGPDRPTTQPATHTTEQPPTADPTPRPAASTRRSRSTQAQPPPSDRVLRGSTQAKSNVLKQKLLARLATQAAKRLSPTAIRQTLSKSKAPPAPLTSRPTTPTQEEWGTPPSSPAS